ncbi:conserved hypothetical protein [Anaeromyxobacter dehalogenans 2CP-1]|uniref:Uncharacterized protein n=1 Tax=Anaeromyxobacter dehalogenans (strain ATCC BAA-258 / DSM 21875 / 2CP-1) TaxID=455488 RepID=B8J9A7_ANAD2|nr:hypothetical protein [Anaeromyxobacter dehalogenans]ACL65513.1 conserved hypothetical protein [Anaeromyxobacter dehalogenans 2CP-1]
MNRPGVLTSPGSIPLRPRRRDPSGAGSARARVEARQRIGKVLVVAGWIVALVGVGIYCVASFAAGADADLAAVLLDGAIPAARGGLAVVGAGTLTWVIGSILHLNASLDAADAERDGPGER